MAGVFLSLRRVLPDRYPLALDVERYIADEQRLGRMLDYAVIVPRLQRLYEWSAEELDEPRLLELVRDGNPIYAWPFEQRHVWRSPNMPLAARYSNALHALAEGAVSCVGKAVAVADPGSSFSSGCRRGTTDSRVAASIALRR